jgi:hypothetical protein
VKEFFKKWWLYLGVIAILFFVSGYVVFIDLPRAQERTAATLAWAQGECEPVPFVTQKGESKTGYRCSHVMKPAKGDFIHIDAVTSGGGLLGWQERPNQRPRALWSVPAECLRAPDGVGLEPCTTLKVDPEDYKQMMELMFRE